MTDGAIWASDPELAAWLRESRLDGFSSADIDRPGTGDLAEAAGQALAKLQAFVAEADARES